MLLFCSHQNFKSLGPPGAGGRGGAGGGAFRVAPAAISGKVLDNECAVARLKGLFPTGN